MNRTDLIRHLEAHDLPEGWGEATVGQVADDISYGFTAKASSSETGPRYLRITDLQNGTVDWGSVPSCRIPREKIEKYSLRRGDLVFARTGATTGKSFLVRSCPEAVFASYLIRVRPSLCVLPEFLALFFQTASYWNQISENISGSAQPNCNATKLASLSVPVPPLDEQRRIVSKLEELLGKVEACQKQLARIPVILKRFRQSVLSAACSGRLTAEWRGSNNEEHGLPHAWERIPLEDLLEKGGIFDGPFGSSLKTEDYADFGVRVVRLENIGHLRFFGDKETYITKEKYGSLIKHTVGYGDIIFSSFIADEIRACLLPQLETQAIAKADCFCLRPDRRVVNRRYLTFQLVSQESYSKLIESVHGATRPRINTTQLRKLQIRMCPLKEQKEIVSRVEALFKFADQIETRYRMAQGQVDKLPQSILAKAFRGELVPTDAELARREGRVRTRLNSSGSSTQGTCPAGQTKARRVARGVKQ